MVARQDLVTDPRVKADLLTARRGTAFFARKLNELSDADLDGPSLLPGWTRRHVIAHVGYNARAIARLVEWAATGVETPMYASSEARNREIEFGATLSPIALHNLFQHSAIHLSVEWRDLPGGRWDYEVRTAQGRLVPVSETVWMRTREVWLHAVDLDNGARFSDIPAEVLRRLLVDIWGAWEKRCETAGLSVVVRDPSDEGQRSLILRGASEGEVGGGAGIGLRIEGPLDAAVRWASGRGTAGVQATREGEPLTGVPRAPRWI